MAALIDSTMRSAAAAAIDGFRSELQELSGEIWRNPELALEEVKAHELLTDFLEKKGFAVERSYTGIKTAFRATFGSGRPNVCVICEYDALPEIGHACGHNLIAEAGVAAGLGLKAALESKGAPQARVTVLGTPAEEAKGGKVYLIENGAFEDVDLAMMVHPTPTTIIKPELLAMCELLVTYTGKAAHAAAFPWEGVNALDAAVMAYTSVSVLRQQMKPTWRVHAVITNGGVKPNIIPEKAELYYYIRAPNVEELVELRRKVVACFEAAAAATGCQVDIREPDNERAYANLMSSTSLAKLYASNLTLLGEKYEMDAGFLSGSSDMGNVSYIVPSIHPMYAIGSGEGNHTRDFTAVANTPEAHAQTLVAAKAMAYTCIDVLSTDGALQEVKRSFEESTAKCSPQAMELITGKS